MLATGNAVGMIGSRRRVRVLVGACVPACVAASRTQLLPRALRGAAAAAAPAALALAAPRNRLRDAAVWALHMHAYQLLYELPHERKLAHRRRLLVGLPLRVDTAIGRGTPTPLRLQRALRRRDGVGSLDVALTAVYASWAAEPHLALAWVLVRHPERFAHAALRLGASFDLTLPFYALAPTAPPWWDAQVKRLVDGDLERVSIQVKRALQGKPVEQGAREVSGNPWASMPSDHFATAVATALLLAEIDPAAGALAWAYAAAVGFSLLYLGEHYSGDLAAGLVLALAVRAAERPAAPLARRAGAAFARLEAAVRG